MEASDWPSAIALLVALSAAPLDDVAAVTVRLLLAQALYSAGQEDAGRHQAEQAHAQAITLGDRGLIWRSLALLESMRILSDGRL